MGSSKKKSHIYKIQTFQSTSLRMITCAPPYVSNHTLYFDLKIRTVQEEAENFYKLFRARLTNHSNPLILALNSESVLGNPSRKVRAKSEPRSEMPLTPSGQCRRRRSVASSCQSRKYANAQTRLS